MIRTWILSFALLISASQAYAQSCPPNIDFEQGNFDNWKLYRGSCCPINTPTPGLAAGRHTITTGTGVDLYGQFPIVAPGGGVYSLKLGNSQTGAQAERARYHVQVPNNINNYSIIFRYAVVFQDPGHIPQDQPRFEVKAFDSATNAIVNCSEFIYISTSGLPGFTQSVVSPSTLYKGWTTASIDLSGYAGRTVIVEFSSGDCEQGAHFGYGYVDLNCGLFQISYNACDTASIAPLSAPPGFQTYTWYDSTSWTQVGTGPNISINKPSVTTTYAVILTPYTGFGCPDTLYTTISVNNLTINASPDTLVCNGGSVQLNANASANATPLSYSWLPTAGLSCSNCASPVATPMVNTTYYVTVTDANNCAKTDSVTVDISNPSVSTAIQNVTCNGGSNGTISATASSGTAPYTYSWNTTPAQITPSITGLAAGNYILTLTDNKGCTRQDTFTVTQPTILDASISSTINVNCSNSSNGSATVNATGGTGAYTYSWNTIPVQTTATATGLAAGTYTVTVTDANGCTDTAMAVITQPNILNTSISASTNINCNGNNNGTATVTAAGGTAPYNYSWNTTPAQTSATATGLAAGTYTVTVTDANGCNDTAMVVISEPAVLNAAINASTNVNCNGNNNGSATATVAGGTAPYSYSWNTSPIQTTANATGLVAGTYTVTVTDANGCSDTANITITQPPVLNTTVTATTNVTCNGGNNGTATAGVTGGTAPYTYSWNTTPAQTTAIATGLAAGTYTVTVTDANGCTNNANALITEPVALNASVTASTNVSCNGNNNGSATVTATGGTGIYTYSWNTTPAQTTATATGLTAGTYTATVTDGNGCTATANITIAQPPVLNAAISSTTNITCNGGNNGAATVNVTGGTAPYTYSWNTTPAQTTATATGLTAGTYTVTVTDANGCTETANVILTEPTVVNASITATTNASCNGTNTGSATVSATGGTAPYSFNWLTTPAQTTATATGLAAGTYTVIVTDANGCMDTTTATVSQPNGLNAAISSTTNITCNGGNNGAATVGVSGGVPPFNYSWNTTPVQTTPTITGLTAGTYTVTVTDANNCISLATAIITQPTVLTPTISVTTDVSCNGGNNGAATVTAAGGTAPYTYSWNTTPAQTTATATGLAAGTYTVTVTDANGCTSTTNAMIAEPGILNAAIAAQNNISCYGTNNGNATATVTGGTAPYAYSWNTTPAQTTATATGLGAGTYTVTVTDANGCTDLATVTITEPTALNTAITSFTDVNCFNGNNGTATVNATGGTAPYSYSWNTIPAQTNATATGLTAGTYTVTITDANGCTDTAMVVISQPNILNATASSSSVINCNGSSNGTATVNATGGTAPYSYSWNTTPAQTTATATGLGAGTYIVTVIDAKGCTDTAIIVLGQPNALNATISSFTNISCNGGNNGAATVNATGGTAPYNYNWNTTPVQTTATATGLTAGTYTVTVTDGGGCSDTAMVIISEPAVVNANIVATTNITCHGLNNGSITASATGGTAPYTYSWNTIPVQTNATASGLSAGTYTVTITDANGCSDTAMAVLSQPQAINATLTSATNSTCFGGNNGTATINATGGTVPYTYSWNTVPAQTTATATGLAAGTYTATVTDANGCTDTALVVLSQPAEMNTIITTTNVNCFGGNNGTASVGATGGTAPYTYSWSTSPVQTTASINNLTAGSYIVTVTDGNGCIKTDTATVAQPQILNAAINAVTNVSCNGGNNGSAIATATGGTAPYTYTWNTTPVQTTATATGLSLGTYIVTISDANGCSDTAIAVISQPVTLAAAIVSASDVSCHGNNDGAATTNVTGGTAPYTFTWNTSPVQTSATAMGLAAGTYTVTVSDANGCSDTATATISEPPAILTTAQATQKTCVGLADGAAEVVSTTGGVPPYTYSWSTSPVQTTTTATNLYAGFYTVTVTDATGCKETATVSVSNYPKPELQVTPDNNICEGETVQLFVSGAISYTWLNAGTLSCMNCNNPIASPNAATTYYVIGTDSNNCKDTAEINIGITGRVPVAVGPEQNICLGEEAQLYAEGGISYIWLPNKWLNNSSASNPVSRATETIDYTVIIKENECFTDTLQQRVNVHPLPTVQLGPDLSGISGTSFKLNADVTGADHIKWSPATGLSCDDCFTPMATVDKTITYTATVTTEMGCKDADDITISVSCEGDMFFVPNTFTPNGDGNNDRFWPIAKGDVLVNHMAIYNRWGEKIFEAHNFPANDPLYGWDGTYKNVPVKPDVFVYIIESKCPTGEIIRLKGDISLVR